MNYENLDLVGILNRLVTSDYLGKADKRACLTELLVRIQAGTLTVEGVVAKIGEP